MSFFGCKQGARVAANIGTQALCSVAKPLRFCPPKLATLFPSVISRPVQGLHRAAQGPGSRAYELPCIIAFEQEGANYADRRARVDGAAERFAVLREANDGGRRPPSAFSSPS